MCIYICIKSIKPLETLLRDDEDIGLRPVVFIQGDKILGRGVPIVLLFFFCVFFRLSTSTSVWVVANAEY